MKFPNIVTNGKWQMANRQMVNRQMANGQVLLTICHLPSCHLPLNQTRPSFGFDGVGVVEHVVEAAAFPAHLGAADDEIGHRNHVAQLAQPARNTRAVIEIFGLHYSLVP